MQRMRASPKQTPSQLRRSSGRRAMLYMFIYFERNIRSSEYARQPEESTRSLNKQSATITKNKNNVNIWSSEYARQPEESTRLLNKQAAIITKTKATLTFWNLV